MESASRNRTEPKGIRVHVETLAMPPATYAFISGDTFDHTLLAVLAGSPELVFKNQRYTAGEAEIHYLKGDCLIRGDERIKFYLLSFTDDYVRSVVYKVVSDMASPLLSGLGYPVAADPASFKIVHKLLDLLRRHQDFNTAAHSETICELTFNLLFSCLAELRQFRTRTGMKRMTRKELIAVQYIRLVEKHCRDHHDVLYYAQQLCMSQGNLARVIKEVTGKAPKSLIEERLVIVIKNLLDEAELSNYIIAEATGFKSSSSFTTFFKLHTTVTPNEYRNRKR